jgi:hypothetical protein
MVRIPSKSRHREHNPPKNETMTCNPAHQQLFAEIAWGTQLLPKGWNRAADLGGATGPDAPRIRTGRQLYMNVAWARVHAARDLIEVFKIKSHLHTPYP